MRREVTIGQFLDIAEEAAFTRLPTRNTPSAPSASRR
jgi:hypothetical protein